MSDKNCPIINLAKDPQRGSGGLASPVIERISKMRRGDLLLVSGDDSRRIINLLTVAIWRAREAGTLKIAKGLEVRRTVHGKGQVLLTCVGEGDTVVRGPRKAPKAVSETRSRKKSPAKRTAAKKAKPRRSRSARSKA